MKCHFFSCGLFHFFCTAATSMLAIKTVKLNKLKTSKEILLYTFTHSHCSHTYRRAHARAHFSASRVPNERNNRKTLTEKKHTAAERNDFVH